MTQELQDEICKGCLQHKDCGYITRSLQYKCPVIQSHEYGYEMGCYDTVKKACEWLERHIPSNYTSNTITFVEQFKKAMEQ